jgi:hypothetical protein
MEKRWINKHVDLALLTTRIGEFFKRKDFNAIKGDTPTGHQIFAEDSLHYRLDGCVSVTIEGKPDDFVVKFELCSPEKKSSLISPLLTQMFLSGYFLSRRLKSAEDWTKLERKFWIYVDNTILQLTSSSKNVADRSSPNTNRV